MDSNAEVHSERDPLLNNSKVQISNGSIQEPDPDYELQEVSIATYKSRWWILTIFSLMSLTQGGLCTIWNVIVGSAEACFGWTTADLSLLLAWNVSTYLVAVVPFIWLLNTKGNPKLKRQLGLQSVRAKLGTPFCIYLIQKVCHPQK